MFYYILNKSILNFVIMKLIYKLSLSVVGDGFDLFVGFVVVGF